MAEIYLMISDKCPNWSYTRKYLAVIARLLSITYYLANKAFLYLSSAISGDAIANFVLKIVRKRQTKKNKCCLRPPSCPPPPSWSTWSTRTTTRTTSPPWSTTSRRGGTIRGTVRRTPSRGRPRRRRRRPRLSARVPRSTISSSVWSPRRRWKAGS